MRSSTPCKRPAQGDRRPQGEHHEAVRRPLPRVGQQVAVDYAGRVEFEDRIVDNMCMQLVQKPELYDVLVLPNLYGDIVVTSPPGSSAASGWRRAPTSGRRRPSSSRSTGRRRSTPARTRRTRPRSSSRRADAAPPRRDRCGRHGRARDSRGHRRGRRSPTTSAGCRHPGGARSPWRVRAAEGSSWSCSARGSPIELR